MKAKTFLTATVTVLLIVLSSCRDKTMPANNMLVPEDVLVKILTDTYLGEGLMDMKEVKDMYGHRDSIANYQDILNQYGFTYQQVDSTLKYYFLYKPRKLENIYDKVTGKLLEIEATVNSENNRGPVTTGENLWNGKESFTFPDDSNTDPIAFDIPVHNPGVYIFKALYQVFPDDESVDPEVKIFFSTLDKTGAEVKTNWDIQKLKKDGKFHTVYFSKMLKSPDNTSIKGWLFFHSNTGTEFKKHARIRDISFSLENESSKEKK